MVTSPPPEAVTSSTESEWTEGWWRSARRSWSPNQGDRPDPKDISLLIVHSISLPPGVFGGGEIEALFTNQLDWDAHPYFQSIRGLCVSSHFLIDRQGAVVQFVSADARAWHAGQSTWRGRENCNDFSIGVELEGLEGGAFTEPQYVALAQLAHSLQRQYPSLREVVGHEHVAPGRKQDPGAGFDWPGLAQRLTTSQMLVGPQG